MSSPPREYRVRPRCFFLLLWLFLRKNFTFCISCHFNNAKIHQMLCFIYFGETHFFFTKIKICFPSRPFLRFWLFLTSLQMIRFSWFCLWLKEFHTFGRRGGSRASPESPLLDRRACILRSYFYTFVISWSISRLHKKAKFLKFHCLLY